MKIEKPGNKLIIRLEGERNLLDIVDSDVFMSNDLTFYQSRIDGWMYLYDAYRDLIFPFNDYHYDGLEQLLAGETLEIEGYDNEDEDWREYEWNEREMSGTISFK